VRKITIFVVDKEGKVKEAEVEKGEWEREAKSDHPSVFGARVDGEFAIVVFGRLPDTMRFAGFATREEAEEFAHRSKKHEGRKHKKRAKKDGKKK